MESVQTARIHVTLTSNGVAHMVLRHVDHRPTAAEMEEDVEAVIGLIGNVPRPAVWDVRGLRVRVSGGGWRALVEQIPSTITFLAIIVDAEAERRLGTFPEAIDNFLVPTHVFTDDDAAWKWIAAQSHAADPPPAG